MITSLFAPLAAAALLAAAGSLHCAAMCGGIAASLTFAVPEQARQGNRLWLWQGLLGLGRITTYSALGALAGLLGNTLLARLNGTHLMLPALLSAVLMLLLAAQLYGFGTPLRTLERLGIALWRRLSPLTGKLLPLDRPLKAFGLGTLWGLLPCGLLYSALLLAAATGHPASGALTMFIFGLITIVPVASTGVFAGQIGRLQRPTLRRTAATLSLGVAMLFIWQALAAPHPAIPDVPGLGLELEHHHHHH